MGNVLVYSVKENKLISKFNFYKKKYKNLDKNLSYIVEKNLIYISDNIGYLYAIDYKRDTILWAKNYKIPFRSNLKISSDKLIAANQNNILYFFNKYSGEIIKSIPTEETVLKNQFVNNISLSEENTFFLNTYGSLYSVNNNSMKINWFLNLNQAVDLNPTNLFYGNEIIINKSFLVISSSQFLYVIDKFNGSIILKKDIVSNIKPLIVENYLFLVTKNYLLIDIDLNIKKIIYYYDINSK